MLWTELFPDELLISRVFYNEPGEFPVTAPEGATRVRVSMVGAGGRPANNEYGTGGGAAFARKKAPCTPGETFTVRVGNPANTAVAGDEYGNSLFRRGTSGEILCLAERGKGHTQSPSYGRASASIGDVTRDGSPPVSHAPPPSLAGRQTGNGGAAGSDLNDDFSLGIGGRGQSYTLSAYFGGGGWAQVAACDLDLETSSLAVNSVYGTSKCGTGQVCVEFFRADPGY